MNSARTADERDEQISRLAADQYPLQLMSLICLPIGRSAGGQRPARSTGRRTHNGRGRVNPLIP